MRLNNIEKGIIAENYIAKQLKEYTKDEIKQNHTWGMDIVLKTAKRDIKIEVKSANRYIRGGKQGLKSGKFQFFTNNLNKPDYFAFVINNALSENKTVWVKGNVIREHFADRKICKSKFALGIPTLMQRIPKIDFSEVVGLD